MTPEDRVLDAMSSTHVPDDAWPVLAAMAEVVKAARPFAAQPGVRLAPEFEAAWFRLCDALTALDTPEEPTTP